MKSYLHLLTDPNDQVAPEVIAKQQSMGATVSVQRLWDREIAYEELLEKIFATDHVQVW